MRGGGGYLIALALLASGCKTTQADIARKVLTAADEVHIAGEQTFGDWNKAHEKQIEAIYPVNEEAEQHLLDYRKTREKILTGFLMIDNAAHAAKKAIDAFEAGVVNPALTIPQALGALYSAGLALSEAAALVGAKIPGLDNLLGVGPVLPAGALTSPSGTATQ